MTVTAVDDDYLPALMNQHFIITVWARDAVIKGDLEGLREPLRALAIYHYPATIPTTWTNHLAALQEAAKRTAETTSLETAAAGVATMSGVCGDCHVETSALAELGPVPEAAATSKSDTVERRMSRHIWAVDRMWLGLTTPSDDAWNSGAAALAHAPFTMKTTNTKLPPGFRTSLNEVRALGVHAQQAKSSRDRSEVYGRTLATCAKCHASGAEVEF